MENYGIPAVAILTEPFVPSGKAMAITQGFVDYPFAVIPHPIAATEYDELNKWADAVLEDVIQILLNNEE